jgi:hypothetical protein
MSDGFEEGRRRHKPRNAGSLLESKKGKQTDSPIKPPEPAQPCQHLDFSLSRF